MSQKNRTSKLFYAFKSAHINTCIESRFLVFFMTKELERNNLRNAFFNSNEIMEQRMELFKYSVKIESSYFAAGTNSKGRIRLSEKIGISNKGKNRKKAYIDYG